MALSTTLQTALESSLPIAWIRPNRLNLEAIRAELFRRHGGWTATKGELNFEKAKHIGDITSVETCDKCFAGILKLISERQGWGDPTEFWKEAELRNWLIKRIGKWEYLNQVVSTMRLDPLITYAMGRYSVIYLVNQKRQELALEKEQEAMNANSKSTTQQGYDFSMTTNGVNFSQEQYLQSVANGNTPLAEVQPYSENLEQTFKRQQSDYKTCDICNGYGHIARFCPNQPQPPSVQQSPLQQQQFPLQYQQQQEQFSPQQQYQPIQQQRKRTFTQSSGNPSYVNRQGSWLQRGTQINASAAVQKHSFDQSNISMAGQMSDVEMQVYMANCYNNPGEFQTDYYQEEDN